MAVEGDLIVAEEISQTGDGRVVAVRFEVDAEGDGISVEATQEGVTVTAVWVSETRLRILADGVFREDAVCRISGGREVRIVSVDVWGYRLGDAGVETFTLGIQKADTTVEVMTEPEMTEEWSQDVSLPVEGPDSTQEEAWTAIETDDPETVTTECFEDTTEPAGKYIGCRETMVRDGRFAVQFLFLGEATPVICMTGGGLLTMGIPVDGGPTDTAICTFRELCSNREYRFWVYDGTVIVEVVYRCGRFFEQDVKSDWYSYTILNTDICAIDQ